MRILLRWLNEPMSLRIKENDMTEQEYKKLLIDMVSFGEYENKEEVVKLLKICSITFEKTGLFAYSGIGTSARSIFI